MNTTPPAPQKRGPTPPERWWRRVNWSVLLNVPRALVACGPIAVAVYFAARWLGQHISGISAVWLCAGALVVMGTAGFPLFRWLFRAAVGLWIRVVHRDRRPVEARRASPRYREIWDQPELLGMRLKEVARALKLSTPVVRWLARHPGVRVHEELIRHLCEALHLDPGYVRGLRDDLSDEYVERRLFHYCSRNLSYAWTWLRVAEATPEARRQILQAIETMRREDIHALKNGGEDA